MKNIVRVIIFLSGIMFIYFFTSNLLPSVVLKGFYVLFSLSCAFIFFVITLENRSPSKTIAWLVILGIFPIFGFFFYLIFGQNYRKKYKFSQKALIDELALIRFRDIEQKTQSQQVLSNSYSKVLNIGKRLGQFPVSSNTKTDVLTNGTETFTSILSAIRDATKHIHLEYYIVRNDEIGRSLKELLINKVKEGVEVRFLYDDVGSWELSKQFIKDLKENGVKIEPFSPVRVPFLNSKINYRNHRKIVIVDGIVGFVGGLNIGDEYLGRNRNFGFWRDTHLRLEGEAVNSLQFVFWQDWFFTTRERIGSDKLYFTEYRPEANGSVQVVSGGPDSEVEVIKNLFFSMITSAKKSIMIATPYFIPDEDLHAALKIAALSGVDVKILFPKNPDKKIVYYASRTYFPSLLEAGVKIYEYEIGFLHSKIVIIDDKIASIGTANMDMRSFHLNFEVNVFLYGTDSINKLVCDFQTDVKSSKEIELEKFSQRHIGIKFIESICRLSSPVL
ncbi:MAG: phospholipase D/Transphosphatidylase [Bacillales bacterium]|jgi:cardiolipin synthase|nr:phospholipase D/Transphosphatidylase [Bacillales bacterium]